jgi:TPR repeat protein
MYKARSTRELTGWWVHALVVLVLILQDGVIYAQNHEPGREQIGVVEKKAVRGDPAAQVELGIAYMKGDGVPVDAVEAGKWFRRAAEQGDPAGEDRLGQMYLLGYGVAVDYTEAVKWLRRAAEQDDPVGEFSLATMYTEGKGVARDYAEALKWLHKAANQNYAPAQFGVALAYERGRGVAQDSAEAVRWYKKAADQAYPDALNNLASLLATSKDPSIRDAAAAIVAARTAVEINNHDPTFFDTLARCYFEARQYEKAVEAEQVALNLSPDEAAYKEALRDYLRAEQKK